MGAEERFNSGGGGDVDRIDVLLVEMALTKTKKEMRHVVIKFALEAFAAGLAAGMVCKKDKK